VGEQLTIQYYLYQPEDLEIILFDVSGKLVQRQTITNSIEGLRHFQIQTDGLPSGNYFIEIKTPHCSYRKKVVKE
jgi:uncharacterized protein YfaS (alpha-2-macroglobulin family)